LGTGPIGRVTEALGVRGVGHVIETCGATGAEWTASLCPSDSIHSRVDMEPPVV
jgi:hypothetical protein